MLIKAIGLMLFFVISFFIVYELSKDGSNKSKPILDFRQTMCFGTCPSYSATIYDNGLVDFHGEEFVKVKGHKKFKLSTDDIANLKNEIAGLNINELKNEYDGEITDLPSTYMTFYQEDGNIVKVRARYNIPIKLADFIKNTSNVILTKLK